MNGEALVFKNWEEIKKSIHGLLFDSGSWGLAITA